MGDTVLVRTPCVLLSLLPVLLPTQALTVVTARPTVASNRWETQKWHIEFLPETPLKMKVPFPGVNCCITILVT